MRKNIKVFKFGGASVKDADAIRNVASILKDYKKERLLVVVSAMGKTTNALEKVVHAFFDKKENAKDLLKQIEIEHLEISKELFGENLDYEKEVSKFVAPVNKLLQKEAIKGYDYIYDQVVSLGELLSTKLITTFLSSEKLPNYWLDARKIIKTDNTYREGNVNWKSTQKNVSRNVNSLLDVNGFVITQGFIGSSEEKATITLGREGSDFTAAIFSFCLDAESMSIWKDVPGILTGDPCLFKKVEKIDRLSYKEAIEMTYYGAKVIHPKTIKPLQNKTIPMYVKSFVDPAGEGTFIGADVDTFYPPVVVVEKDQVMLQISTKDFSFVAEHHLSFIFTLFTRYRTKVNMMQNTAISFSVCVTVKDLDRLTKLIQELKETFNVVVEKHLELVTIRHYHKSVIEQMKKHKIVMLEERIRQTIQMVMKDVPVMERK
ncbi:MAG: aspartate kinase [Saprospiraceae bacterium]|nr:aspartate kinase [Saprospiraceae bacterium]